MVEKQPQSKQIYIFENQMYPILKIGMSDNPLKRMKTVQGAAGFPLVLAYESEPILEPRTVEFLIHKELDPYRKGGEWFELDVETAKNKILECLKEAKKGIYKDISINYQLEYECTKVLDYNIHSEKGFNSLIEVEPFIYRSQSYNYYIAYFQGSLKSTIKFCNKALALKFKKDNLERLISR